MEPLVATQIAVAAVQNVLFATAAGSLACEVLGKRGRMGVPAALRGWQAGLTIALALTALAYLWLQAAVMSGSPLAEAGTTVIAVLTQAHHGVAWSVGFIGALLATLSRLSDRRGLPLFAAGLIAWAAGKAAASHAADAGDFSMREAIHVVHLCATALWAGSVIVAAAVLRRSPTADATAEKRLAFRNELSCLATAALVVVLVTGFYNVMQDTTQADVRFFAMAWAWILAAKLVCVAAAVALGGWNRLLVLPELRARAQQDGSAFTAAQKRFDALLSVEALAMLAILTIASHAGTYVTDDRVMSVKFLKHVDVRTWPTFGILIKRCERLFMGCPCLTQTTQLFPGAYIGVVTFAALFRILAVTEYVDLTMYAGIEILIGIAPRVVWQARKIATFLPDARRRIGVGLFNERMQTLCLGRLAAIVATIATEGLHDGGNVLFRERMPGLLGPQHAL